MWIFDFLGPVALTWPNDLHIWSWHVLCGDTLDVQIWTSYVKAFESYYLTDRQTELAKIIDHWTGMVYFVSGCTRGVQVKLWDSLRTRAIPECIRGVFMTRRYTNPHLPLPLPYHTTSRVVSKVWESWTLDSVKKWLT